MTLALVPIPEDDVKRAADHWLPFLPAIAKRSKEPIGTLIDLIENKQRQVILIWDDQHKQAVAMLGMTYHMRGKDEIAEWVWMVGRGYKAWQHLLPELEQYLRDIGCAECRPLCRPGWRKILEAAGYKLTHIQLEKPLWEPAEVQPRKR